MSAAMLQTDQVYYAATEGGAAGELTGRDIERVWLTDISTQRVDCSVPMTLVAERMAADGYALCADRAAAEARAREGAS